MSSSKIFGTGLLASSLFITSCASKEAAQKPDPAPTEEVAQETPALETNPLFVESTLPYKLPPFDKIKDEHFGPAFERGFKEHLAEIDAIVNKSEAATFDNTLVPMQMSAALLDRTSRVFYNLISTLRNDALEKIESDLAPKYAAHMDSILLNAKLFERIKIVHAAKDTLDAESKRLVEVVYRDFVRAGANLSDEQKPRMKEINAELASLSTAFSQNVQSEVNDSAIVVDTKAELEGLSDDAIETASKEAESRKMPGKFIVPLLNTSGQPTMSSLKNRALRERMMKASLARGSRGSEFDNRETLVKTMKLRAERANLLGFPTHAAYSLDNQTAKTVDAVNQRIKTLSPAAVKNAKRELADLKKMAKKDGVKDFGAHDWSFYSEKVRTKKYAFDASQLKPYLELNSVLIDGVFFAATKLYGITFKERTDLALYHEDVRAFEVFNEDGSALALFLFDPYARASKRGGAWMNAYVSQNGLRGDMPLIANHQNVAKPAEGTPALLTFDEVTTMFHEFGHALHGMFSEVKYPEFSGTSVPRDFVEYPSQVNEMWAVWPEVLKNYAKHHKTGEAMPAELLKKVLDSQIFNQGFGTTEYLKATAIDQGWHQLAADKVPSADKVVEHEQSVLKSYKLSGIDEVPPRYRSTYFSHIMGGYSAGYYSYIWSEVLDADTVEWFKENGGLLRKNGDHFRKTLLSRGGTIEAMQMFKNFRGKEPNIEPLLIRRGLK